MAKQYTWKLNAKVLASYTSEAGDIFLNAIEEIHWRCIVSEGDATETVYGSLNLPKPTDAATYVDLSAISGSTDADKKAMILGWAEALEPGFKQSTEDLLAARLDAVAASPAVSNVTII